MPVDNKADYRWRFGPFALAPERRELTTSGRIVPLASKGMSLLLLLIEHRHKVLTFDEMLHRVWGTTARSRGVVAQVIKQIRKALSDDADAPLWIGSCHGVGYRFIGAIDEIGSAAHARNDTEELHRRASASNGRLLGVDAGSASGLALEGPVHVAFDQGLDALERHDAAALDEALKQLCQFTDRRQRSTAQLYVTALTAARALRSGDFQAARLLVSKGRTTVNAFAHPAARVDFHLAAARVEIATQAYRDALLSLEAAWSVAVQHGTSRQAATCAHSFGLLLSQLYLYALAIGWLERARDIARQGEHRIVEALCDRNLLSIRVAQENDLARMGHAQREPAWRVIVADIEATLARYAEHELPIDITAAFRASLGISLAKLGRNEEATSLLVRQIDIFDRVHMLDRFAATSYYLADIHLTSGQSSDAIAVCLRGIAACETRGLYPIGYKNLLETLADAFDATGDASAAANWRGRRSRLDFVLAEMPTRDEAILLDQRLKGASRRIG